MDVTPTIIASPSNVTESSVVNEAEPSPRKKQKLIQNIGQVSFSPVGLWKREEATDCASDFTIRTWKDDFTLIVENKHLYVSKAILVVVSPVFDTMFQSEFKEKNVQELELPGKKFEDVQDFLRCIYPGVMADVSRKNVYRVLPLAEEYQVVFLKSKCEQYLLNSVWGVSIDEKYDILGQAITYNMEELLRTSINFVASQPIKSLDDALKRMTIPVEIVCKIKDKMVRRLEMSEKSKLWYEDAYKFILSGMKADEKCKIEKCRGWTYKSIHFSMNVEEMKGSGHTETLNLTNTAWKFTVKNQYMYSNSLQITFSKEENEGKRLITSVLGRLVIRCGLSKNEDFTHVFEMRVDEDLNRSCDMEIQEYVNIHSTNYLFDETKGFIFRGQMKAEIYLLFKEAESRKRKNNISL